MTLQREQSVPIADPSRVPLVARWKRFSVMPEFIAAILTEGWRGDGWHTVRGIPEGATVVSAHVDRETGALMLVVQHESFAALAPGAQIPLSLSLRIDNEAS